MGMKFIQMLLLAGVVLGDPYERCLKCKKDDYSDFLFHTHSYCFANEDCLLDKWNFIDYPCPSGWRRGNTITVDECKANEYLCPNFVSKKELLGEYRNVTW